MGIARVCENASLALAGNGIARSGQDVADCGVSCTNTNGAQVLQGSTHAAA